MSRKCMRLVILTLLSKLENVSWPQAITYTIHVVVYGRRCKIERLLQQTANSKWYLAYRVARWAVPHSETTIYYFLSKIWRHHRVLPISSTQESPYIFVSLLYCCVFSCLVIRFLQQWIEYSAVHINHKVAIKQTMWRKGFVCGYLHVLTMSLCCL